MNRDHPVVIEIASKYCILDSFVDWDGCSISSKGFLPTVVDIMVMWVRFTHSSPFNFLIPKMSNWFLKCFSKYWLPILRGTTFFWWISPGQTVCVNHSVVPYSLCSMDCSPPGSSVHGIFPGKNTGVICYFLLQGIFPTQDQTWVSCTAGRFFTNWATRETPNCFTCLKLVKQELFNYSTGDYLSRYP